MQNCKFLVIHRQTLGINYDDIKFLSTRDKLSWIPKQRPDGSSSYPASNTGCHGVEYYDDKLNLDQVSSKK